MKQKAKPEQLKVGLKLDGGKPPIHMIPPIAIILEAQVMGHGAEKYEENNFRKGIDSTRLISAAMRHILAYSIGQTVDQDTYIHHLAHARCCLAFLIEQDFRVSIEKDTRFKFDPNVATRMLQELEARQEPVVGK